jgi:hypothetical protein
MSSDNYTGGTPATYQWSSDMTLDRISDGTSMTLLAGEKHVPFGELAKQGSLYNGDNGNNAGRGAGNKMPLARTASDRTGCATIGSCQFCACDNFGSWHHGTVLFAYVDGHVDSLSTSTSVNVLTNLASRSNGR